MDGHDAHGSKLNWKFANQTHSERVPLVFKLKMCKSRNVTLLYPIWPNYKFLSGVLEDLTQDVPSTEHQVSVQCACRPPRLEHILKHAEYEVVSSRQPASVLLAIFKPNFAYCSSRISVTKRLSVIMNPGTVIYNFVLIRFTSLKFID